MFRIPDFHKMEMTFEEAKNVLTIDNDLLKGMEHVNEHWERYCADESLYEDDDAFFEMWVYEVNAYNKVYSTMKPLFVA